ncbi:Octopamine receptor 1 [Halotydeus destructor]|nr:Octopamine receptor 1 [Halotydeus destructor]
MDDVNLGIYNYSEAAANSINSSRTGSEIYEICSYRELVQVKLSNATVALSVILLLVINAMVIAGNILVILAVFVSSKLRTSTNYFIVSLALADLLVGIAVLPYSVTHDVLDVWIFGEVWCQGWLVVDVWLCTASILNLCAISVDRYLAVTRPVRYRSMMTSRRAKMVIIAVWLLSFLICFPPLVGWNGRTSFSSDQGSGSGHVDPSAGGRTMSDTVDIIVNQSSSLPTLSRELQDGFGSYHHHYHHHHYQANVQTIDSVSNVTSSVVSDIQMCPELGSQCTLFSEKGYVIYSALGSFYIPMLFMFFFYWRIYLVASRTTRALKRGYRTTKSSKSSQGTAGSPEERMTLRIHRGYMTGDSGGGEPSATGATLSAGHNHHPAPPSPRFRAGFFNKPTIVESQCGEGDAHEATELRLYPDQNFSSSVTNVSKCSQRRKLPVTLYRSARLSAHLAAQDAMLGPSEANGRDHNKLSPTPSVNSNMYNMAANSPSSPSSSRESSARMARFSRRANNSHTGKWQAKRFHAETKAAKTVGIIVGGFIICWFPFFTAYLVRAFCDHCFPDLLMSIFTWLGYCNSAINPIIYGLFSRDFRRAFKNIVCRCKCKEEVGVTSLIRQIHMPTFFEEDQIMMNDDLVKSSNDDYK